MVVDCQHAEENGKPTATDPLTLLVQVGPRLVRVCFPKIRNSQRAYAARGVL